MNANKTLGIGCLLAATVIGISAASAAGKVAESWAGTSAQRGGEKHLGYYSTMLTVLQTEIARSLPKVDEQKKAAFLKAYQDEAAATAAELQAMLAQGGKHVKDKEAAGKAHAEAKEALALAAKNALPPSKAVLAELEKFLSSDKLDTKLVKCVVLTEATPRGLAEFAQQGKEQEALVEKLLGDDALMKQMLVAGGARDGKYGQAMQIYAAIQKASPKAGEGLFQRLALGTSLEHAVPVAQSNPKDETNAPAVVDPVKRYLHYEKAYLDGELDPAFKDLSAWEYRNVVNGDEPDHVLAWGRAMLRNYRPDHIYTPDFRWRYVAAVKTEVKYGSQEVKNDRPSLQEYQNIIKDGGVCGRRAFFGRFILRSFGIPTVARPQPGHATLAHWTPSGWVINLGAGWGWGRIKNNADLDFLAMTQARKAGAAYLEVLRAQWIGDVLGEPRAFGFHSAASGFWNGAALYRQRAIVDAAKTVALEAVGQDIGEANVSKEKEVVVKVAVTEADKKIGIGPDGAITIPAVACSKPKGNTKAIIFMKDHAGGMQLHYNRLGGEEAFEYTFDAPQAGKYALVARVVTVSSDQNLLVSPNDAKEPIAVALPYTVGMWQKSEPVEIALVKGQNVLRFTRKAPFRGLTIKEFTLTPAK